MSIKDSLKGPFFHVWLLLFIGLSASVGFLLSGSEPARVLGWGLDRPGEWLVNAYRWKSSFFMLIFSFMIGAMEMMLFGWLLDMMKTPRWIHCLSLPLYLYFCWGKDWGQICFMVVQVTVCWAGGLVVLTLLRFKIRQVFNFSTPGKVPASMTGSKAP
jgi:hypothetical protein